MDRISYHQHCNFKNNCKRKSSRRITPSNHFTIILNSSSSNTNNNTNNNSQNKKHFNEVINSEKTPLPEPIDCNIPRERNHCISRQGELIINGGFENCEDPFFGWVINSGVEEIDPNGGDIAHQGKNAARMGYPEPCALLYQDVPGICPGSFYQLNFFLSAATLCSNACVNVNMEFLDKSRNLIGCPVLEILIPKNSLSNEVFTGFINATHVPAPPCTRFARISFAIDTNQNPDKYVHLDDVSLIAI